MLLWLHQIIIDLFRNTRVVANLSRILVCQGVGSHVHVMAQNLADLSATRVLTTLSDISALGVAMRSKVINETGSRKLAIHGSVHIGNLVLEDVFNSEALRGARLLPMALGF